MTAPLFYPGQSSYEWLLPDARKGAAKETRRGDACGFCHDEPDGEQDIGNAIVVVKRLEPNPPKGKNGHIDLKAPAALDDKHKALKAGGVLNAGFAVQDENITSRGHQVGWRRTPGLGAKADRSRKAAVR